MTEAPTTSTAGRPERLVVAFVTALRRAGLVVPVGSTVAYAEALGRVGLHRQDRVYWAGRATLLCRHEDVDLYDQVFESFWLGRELRFEMRVAPRPLSLAVDDQPDGDQADDQTGEDFPHDVTLRWSAVEVLRDKDFSTYTASDWDELQRLIARLSLSTDVRRARRRRPDRHHRGHPDLRRTVRRALRTGGEPIDRAWRAPTDRPRRLVLLVDVSGSMEAYARALLRFAHAAVTARGALSTEVFTLGTRLTRVTRQLAVRDPDAAFRAASGEVADWSGGTRLGDGLEEFNDRWGCRGMARGAVMAVLSDGWDRGDPERLAEQMGRLARVAHRVVWVNPLKATPGYAPLARGMAAALPYVDDFVEGHSLTALEHLADVVGGRGSWERRTVT